MLKIFRQPYAVLEPPIRQVFSAALIGSFIALFLLLFEPFGLNLWQTDHKWLKIAGFGLITFVLTTLHYIIWPTLFPHFFAERQWTVGRAILFLLLNVAVIAIGNFLYLGWLLRLPFSWENLGGVLFFTMAVGIFPVGGSILYGYIRRLRMYEQGAAQIHPPTTMPLEKTVPNSPLASVDILTLTADNEKDTLKLTPTDLLFIESSDNYCTVYYLREGKLQKPLLRSSLSRMESQLTAQPRLVRCHRSFIVNLDQVERVTGNAQGYKLHLFDGQLEVPVARRYNETLVAGLKGS
jgi:hypothetical protein